MNKLETVLAVCVCFVTYLLSVERAKVKWRNKLQLRLFTLRANKKKQHKITNTTPLNKNATQTQKKKEKGKKQEIKFEKKAVTTSLIAENR